ncbi:MAG: hypothetical protein CL489_05820 [Acidobacteria bacterium]|nr:hypothetical protein [Acidobacteriota bacterium]
MAYLWSDKITDYYWSNPELDTVAIAWTDPDDGLTREHYIMVDETDDQWNDFVKEVPYEKINERTENRHEQFREQFREAFRDWMTRDENNMTVQYKTVYEDRETVVEKEVAVEVEVEKEKVVYRDMPWHEIILSYMINFDPEDARQKEELFKLKLKIFEENPVRNSKSSDKFKNAKTFIRKAETPLDVLLGYFVCTEQAELQVADKEKFEVEGVYIPIK